MKRYDPNVAPDPAAWLALDETDRLQLAGAYHRRARIRLPSLDMHAAIHGMVENQIAMGDETPVEAVSKRLLAEGLDRHDMIHAIGSAFTSALFEVSRDKGGTFAVEQFYYAELGRPTAERCRLRED